MKKFLLPLVLGLVVMTSVFASNVNASDSAKVNSSAVKVDEKLTGVTEGKVTVQFQKLMQKAANGDAEAQFNLGLRYYKGQGVTQNYTAAVKYFKLVAEQDQGHASAQFNLGLMYHYGQGVVENHTEAVKWYEKAAKQGLASAQYNLGVMYELGLGEPQDYEKALKYYTLYYVHNEKKRSSGSMTKDEKDQDDNIKSVIEELKVKINKSKQPGIFRRSMNWFKGLF